MKKLLVMMFALTLTTTVLTGCNSDTATPPQPGQEVTESVWISTALEFHIETAASDLRNAIKDAKQENIISIVKFVNYAQMTIPQAADIAQEDGQLDIENQLKVIDQRITDATAGEPDIINLVEVVESVSLELESMLK